MNIFKKILIGLAFILRLRNKKYSNWWFDYQKQLVKQCIKRININKDNIIIK